MRNIIFLVSTLLLTATGYCQFIGGSEDGSTRSTLIGSQLNGSIESFAVLYQGSNGDGFDGDRIQTILSGQNLSLYEGGRGDGFATDRSTSTTNGVEIAILYSGSSGDGWAKALETTLLNGGGISQVFTGGSGDGFDRAVLFNTLIDGLVADLYNGGIGDGHSSLLSGDNLLSGLMLLIFNGGAGDGHASQLQTNNLLSGLMLALYGGGDGDGYAFNKFTSTLALDVIEELIRLDVLLYPNPANSIVNIKPSDGIVITSIQMFDLSGKEIKTNLSRNNTLNVSNLSDGIYLLNILSDKGRVTKKLIVKK